MTPRLKTKLIVSLVVLLANAGSGIVPAGAQGTVPAFDHIFVIIEENHAFSDIIGSTQAPYINGLAGQNGLATQYSAISHPSLPNYLALTGGDTFGITTDCPVSTCPVNAPNIADRIEAAGKTWKGYMDAMPSACSVSPSSTYSPRHNPFVYFNDIRNDAQRCSNHVVPYPNLAADLASTSTTPNFVWITPDLCNDMHDCAISVGDMWLANNLPAIFSSPAWTTQRSLLLLTWDEGGTTNQVATVVIGPSVIPGYQSPAVYSHYSLLKTVESAWNLAPLTANDGSASPMADFFGPAGLLRVPSSPALPTQVLVDGQIADSWGLNWLKEGPGTHTVCFTHVEGWTEPACQTVAVNGGATTLVTGSFTQRGSLHVFTSPTVPSQITLDGNPTDDWGMFTDVPTGAHTVCYGKVADYDPPACQSITVNAGALTTTTGTFNSHPGALGQSGVGLLRVTQASPAVPTQISIKPAAGTPYVADSWGLNWLELAPGSYTVSFSHVEGWTEPPPQAVTVTAGNTTTVAATFIQRGDLHVFTSPPVAGTVWVDGIPRNDWGMFTDIPTGSHTVCFGAAAGYANTPACQPATVNAGVETDVTGIYS